MPSIPAPFPCAGVMSNGGFNNSMPGAGRLQLHADGLCMSRHKKLACIRCPARVATMLPLCRQP